MTERQRTIILLLIACAIVVLGLAVAAWPATGTLGPVVTPTTYGPPGPNGGPQ